ncbi:MAG: hypothetical protein E7191_02620 [Erysipelotrichaceae bacterium]|nr:hypothetical protein [Erysipelotrichaceae bacterium]
MFQNKELVIFNHYKYLIENRLFDEFDILGFLIFIREYVDESKYIIISEYCNLIAHRTREHGKTMDAIKQLEVIAPKVIRSTASYDVVNKKKKPAKRYKLNNAGIKESEWNKELDSFFQEYGIQVNEQIKKEFILCIFSFAQNTNYENGNVNGKAELLQMLADNTLILTITLTDGTKSPVFVFSIVGPFNFLKKLKNPTIEEAVVTKRENGELRLLIGDEYLT